MSTNNNNMTTSSLTRGDSNSHTRDAVNNTKKSTANKKQPKPKPKQKYGKEYGKLNDDFSQKIENQIKNGKTLSGTNRKNQISINHLLEFQSYRDLKEYQNRHSKRRNSNLSKSAHHHGNRSKDNYYSKVHLKGMSFINVNYKFVVDYRKDYKPQQLDPNVPIDTKDILRIVAPKGNSCPICLSDEPIAPRMITSCGHILCLTCLLSLLESEIPVFKKRESTAIVEKYRDCPLCFSVIRKNEIKPVLINNIDERFEVPKVNDEVVLTLMARPHDKVLALPSSHKEFHDVIDNFPWVNESVPEVPDFGQYLRIFKGDLNYLIDMYDSEKKEILASYEEEKLLYNDDGRFTRMAIANIDEDIANWKDYYKTVEEKVPSHAQEQHLKHAQLNSSNTYFYYQTGFNASSRYVLSPLDMKILKTNNNNDYTTLPSSIVAKIENIRYEELAPESSITKYKYLSHLPLGTTIGFLECNWFQSEFISSETWKQYKNDLIKRTKNSTKKFLKEEKDKKRALNQEEIRTRNFYERENNGSNELDDYYDYQIDRGHFGSLSIIDHRDLPPLSSDNALENPHNNDIGSDSSTGEYQTTIWGTKIPKAEIANDDVDSDDWDAAEMIRKAKEEINRQENDKNKGKGKHKKKKKLVLLSSNSTWKV